MVDEMSKKEDEQPYNDDKINNREMKRKNTKRGEDVVLVKRIKNLFKLTFQKDEIKRTKLKLYGPNKPIT